MSEDKPFHEKSATEVLMETLEEFGSSEGSEVVIIFTNQDRDVVLKTNCRRPTALGLLDIGHAMALNNGESLR